MATTAGSGAESNGELQLVEHAKVGKYTLLRPVGKGGMGVVWAARDPDLDREVALKLLHVRDVESTLQRRFLREARAMARLKHPNVLTVYEVGTHIGRDYIAMELVDGRSFDRWLEAKPTQHEVWGVLMGAGQGLVAAHEAGLVHRDFKPHNVLIRNDGRALVTDFGLVRSLDESDGTEAERDPKPVPAGPVQALDATLPAEPSSRPIDSKLTHTGSLLGTPAYMAPEQFTGAPSDPRTDQFAFCITAWQALTGARPYRGESVDDLYRAALAGAAQLDARLPKQVRDVLVRGLAPEPADRFATMKEVLAALDHARNAPRRRKLVLAAVLVVATLVSAVMVTYRLRRPGWRPEIVTIEPVIAENSDAPAISPDGTTMVFSAGRVLDQPWSLYFGALAGGETSRLDIADAWWPRWDGDHHIIFASGSKVEEHRRIVRVPVRGGIGAPQDLGPGALAEPCGDKLLVSVIRGRTKTLVERTKDGRDTELVSGPLSRVRCDRAGEAYAYIFDDRTGFDHIELWLVKGGERRLVLKGGVMDMAFTPGSHSLVIARGDGTSFELHELMLDDLTLHRLTDNVNARAVDVSFDGTIVLFDDDVTRGALFEHTGSEKRELTFKVEFLHRPAISPAGDHVVMEREENVGTSIVVVPLNGGPTKHLEVSGHAPFFSRDGTRVLFADANDRRRLNSVPAAGGPVTKVADLPMPILDGTDSPAGIQLELGDRDQGATHAWTIDLNGVKRDTGLQGLAFVAPSGWRAQRIGRVLRVHDPSGAVVFERPDNSRPFWVGEHRLGHCDKTTCYVLDMVTGLPTTTPVKYDESKQIVVAPDGKRWYSTQAVGRVTRRKIVNFADRSWRP